MWAAEEAGDTGPGDPLGTPGMPGQGAANGEGLLGERAALEWDSCLAQHALKAASPPKALQWVPTRQGGAATRALLQVMSSALPK